MKNKKMFLSGLLLLIALSLVPMSTQAKTIESTSSTDSFTQSSSPDSNSSFESSSVGSSSSTPLATISTCRTNYSKFYR